MSLPLPLAPSPPPPLPSLPPYYLDDGQHQAAANAMQVYDETEPDSAEKPVLGEKGRRYRKVNWMKGAFLSADKLLTVSPTYAEEIAANESQGVELDNVIRYCELEPAGSMSTLGSHLCVPAIIVPFTGILPTDRNSVFSSASASCCSNQQWACDRDTMCLVG